MIQSIAMKHFLTTTLLVATALLSCPAEAEYKVSNHFFEVEMINTDTWDRTGDSPIEIPIEDVMKITQDAIDYWGDLLVNHYATFDTSKKITVSIEFRKFGNYAYGTAEAKLHKVWATNYNYMTAAGAALLNPSIMNAGDANQKDITLEFNTESGFKFLEDSTSKDFHTVLLHELTHGMGFYAGKYKATGADSFDSGSVFSTPYDYLITDALNGETLALGKELEFGDTGMYVYNPEVGDPGSSFVHVAPEYIDDEQNIGKKKMVPYTSLMRPSFTEDMRYLSEGDIAIFNEMGYNLVYVDTTGVPEPSTAALILILTPALLLRRRRKL